MVCTQGLNPACIYRCCPAEPQPEPQQPEQPQQLVVQDDLDQLLDVLPSGLGAALINHPQRSSLIEVGSYQGWPLTCGKLLCVVHNVHNVRMNAAHQNLPGDHILDMCEPEHLHFGFSSVLLVVKTRCSCMNG